MDILTKASVDGERTVALVATGQEKSEALRSLCRSKIGNTLVIDKELASGILRSE